jgi:hypothetical protein
VPRRVESDPPPTPKVRQPIAFRNMTGAVCWPAIREWLIALGTVGATVVALYVGVLRDRFRRPSLDVSFDPTDSRDLQVVGMRIDGHPKGGTRAAYARLKVTNRAGRNTAEEVQVLVERVRLPKLGRDPTPDSEHIGEMPLAVSGSWPTATHLNLAPGVGRHFDCVHVRKDQSEDGRRYVNLDVVPQPADLREKIRADRIELDIVVTARNADAKFCTVGIEFDGKWPEDDRRISDHFRVEVLGRRV